MHPFFFITTTYKLMEWVDWPHFPHAFSSCGYLQLFVTADLSMKTFEHSEAWERNSLPCGPWSSICRSFGLSLVRADSNKLGPSTIPSRRDPLSVCGVSCISNHWWFSGSSFYQFNGSRIIFSCSNQNLFFHYYDFKHFVTGLWALRGVSPFL